MNKSLKKFVLVVVAAAFLLGSADILLYMHLAEHKNDAGHDHKNCPVCQHAAINKNKAVVLFISIVFELPQITITNADVIECFVTNAKFITPYLRAPPFAA